MTVDYLDKQTLARVMRLWIRQVDEVLDLGCGIHPQNYIKPKLHICVEPYGEYVDKLRRDRPDVVAIQDTAQQALKQFRAKSVDTVFLMDFIEHVSKTDGFWILSECQRIARKQIVVFTPLGFAKQEYSAGDIDAWGMEGGEWQTHRSGWLPSDFNGGWRVLAAKEFYTENGKGEKLNPPAGALFAVKNLDTQPKEGLPLVSIVTPAYNHAAYLHECIQSVLAQDYPNIEHIVLDDGSTDNTREVLAKYSGRIWYNSHPNMGETRTTNKGFAVAKGDMVGCLSADDVLLPHAVSTLVKYLQEQPDILVAYPDFDYINADSRIVGHIDSPDYDYLYMLRRHSCIVGAGHLMRAKAVRLTGGRDPQCHFVGDFDFWLRLGLHGRMAHIPQTLARLRIHPGSGSVYGKGKVMAEEHPRITKKLYSLPDLPQPVLDVRNEAFAWAYVIGAAVSGKSYRIALWYYLRGILYHPASVLKESKKWSWALMPWWVRWLIDYSKVVVRYGPGKIKRTLGLQDKKDGRK